MALGVIRGAALFLDAIGSIDGVIGRPAGTLFVNRELTPHEHDVGHDLQYAEAVDPARHPDGQAFAGELIDQGHQPELAAIVGLGLHEVVAPHVIASLRPEPDAGSIVEPEPAAWPLFFGYFKPLTAPDPLHAIAAHVPPGIVQQ